ncbi:DEAD/DEAH box helicase [Pseudogemmobacter sp. W21_MBD1_M6]|uniref:DEAD/DEAH box helicase n=1 Tax=Pseudogemmobacter sp. W21_MBD1_M6 TaxID=3240271 RepID=UPI003F9AA822
MTTFADLGLSPTLLKAITDAGYNEPTPIQERAIPLLLDGHDLMGLAQTGTGKTAAFGLPIIESLMSDGFPPAPKTAKALILAPTRELVNQISDNLRGFVKKMHLRVTTVVGGQSIGVQIKNLEKGTDILVATPGRLMDLLDRRAVSLEKVRVLVLDEADQMLDLGFIHALRKIAPLCGTPRQTMLFSATMPKQMAELSAAYLTNPRRVQVATPGQAADKVVQSVHFISNRSKADLLKTCLEENPDGLALVFARTKHGAEKLMKHLVEKGFRATSIHGNKSQGQRDRAIKAFKEGSVRILVATDVAARGIDIPGVSHVYNYELPDVPENYVHRIGRTARAGRDGQAVAFCAAAEVDQFKAIEKLMGIKIPVASGIMPPAEAPEPRGRPQGRRPGNAGGGRPGGKPSFGAGRPEQGRPAKRGRSKQKTA